MNNKEETIESKTLKGAIDMLSCRVTKLNEIKNMSVNLCNNINGLSDEMQGEEIKGKEEKRSLVEELYKISNDLGSKIDAIGRNIEKTNQIIG